MKKTSVIILLFMPLFVFAMIAVMGIAMDTERPEYATELNLLSVSIKRDSGTEFLTASNGFYLATKISEGDKLQIAFSYAPFDALQPDIKVTATSNTIFTKRETSNESAYTVTSHIEMTFTGKTGNATITAFAANDQSIAFDFRILVRS